MYDAKTKRMKGRVLHLVKLCDKLSIYENTSKVPSTLKRIFPKNWNTTETSLHIKTKISIQLVTCDFNFVIFSLASARRAFNSAISCFTFFFAAIIFCKS